MKVFTKFQDIFLTFEGPIDDFTSKFHSDMKTKNKEKTKVIAFCTKKLTDEERKAERLSIKKIEEYKKAEKYAYKAIEEALRQKKPIDYDQAENMLMIQ